MLEKKRRSGLRLERQRGAGRTLAQPDRSRKVGDLCPDDITPTQDQSRVDKTPACKSFRGQRTSISSDRSNSSPPRINRLGRTSCTTL